MIKIQKKSLHTEEMKCDKKAECLFDTHRCLPKCILKLNEDKG